MATLVLATEPGDQSTWEIKKDVFMPPPTRRLIRGWDRAPVPARAPRLQGQKVWKKVDIKVARTEDKQDEMQEELQKEGAGARKKSRRMTVRENICNAMWVEAIPDPCGKDLGKVIDPNGQVESLNALEIAITDGSKTDDEALPIHKDGTPKAESQDSILQNLQFIPRKRTNTNHVITPQKSLRQTTLRHIEEEPSTVGCSNGKVAKATRRKKSLRKSIISALSDNAADLKTSRAQTQLSSTMEPLADAEGIASASKESEISVGETAGKQRISWRSTAATRRSMAHTESLPENGHAGLQSADQGQQDTPFPVPSMRANSVTTRMCGSPHSNSNLRDVNGLALTPQIGAASDCRKSLGMSTSSLTSTTDLKVPDNADRPLETSVDSSGYCEHFQVTGTEENGSERLRTSSCQNTEGLVTHTSCLEPEGQATPLPVQERLVRNHDVSNADGDTSTADGGLIGSDLSVTSPIPTSKTSPLKSGGDVPPTESEISSMAPEGLDIHQNIQNIIEPPQVPDVRNSSLTAVYDHDDTDMLRNFLTRVKANKAAKNPPKRKRSLPHSPLRIPLGDIGNNVSPSPQRKEDEPGTVEPSPSKRKQKGSPLAQAENEPEPTSCRRSGRTRPPVKDLPGAPSLIPVRRLGQDMDNTITLKRNEEKELAALTRVNTRKNKGNALPALEVIAKKAQEKEDPVMRQKLLKEVLDEKMEKGRQVKEKRGKEKSVTWAEELVQFRTLAKGKSGQGNDDKEMEKVVLVQGGEDKKQGAVRVGVRSKAALSMALNGTPAPKRKMRGQV